MLLHRDYSAWADVVTPHACVIQRIYRSWRSRMIIRAARAARIKEARRVAALGMQAAFRGHKGRVIAHQARERKRKREELAGARALQRLTRGYLARKRVDRFARGALRQQLKTMGLGSLSMLYVACFVVVVVGFSWPFCLRVLLLSLSPSPSLFVGFPLWFRFHFFCSPPLTHRYLPFLFTTGRAVVCLIVALAHSWPPAATTSSRIVDGLTRT